MDRRLYQKGVVLLVVLLCQLTVQAQNNQQWRDSLTVLNRMIDTQPWSTDLHLRKAAVNLELKQWQYAIDEYAMILQKEPHNPAALFYRAYANTHLRHFDLAKNDLNDLLIVVPNHFEARLSLAIVLQQLGRKQEALDNLNQLIQQHADSAVAYAARANLERQMKQDDAALYDWQRAEQLSPCFGSGIQNAKDNEEICFRNSEENGFRNSREVT